MTLKKSNFVIVFFVICLSLVVHSCINEEKNFYDPTYKTPNPLEITAPEGFNGQTVSSIKIRVDVNDEFDGAYDYTVSFYDRNPLNEGANQLAVGVAKKGEPYETDVNFLKGTTLVYIEQTDPRGRKSVASVNIEGNTSDLIYYNFAHVDATTQPQLRKATTRVIANRPTYNQYTTSDIPWSAKEITPSTVIQSYSSYTISNSYTGTFTHNGTTSSKLFITGEWNFDSFIVESGLQIIVLSGGKIKANNLHLVNNSSLEVMNGGEAEIGTLQLSNNNRVINLGRLILGDTSNNPGVFYNGENAYMSVSGTLNVGGALLYNDGLIYAKNIDSTWGNQFVNNCHIEVSERFRYEGGYLELNTSAIIAKVIELNGNTVYLLSGSMLKATQEMLLGSNTTFLNYTNGTRSLIKSPSIDFSANILYGGALMIEADTHPSGTIWWSPYTLANGAMMTSYNGSNLIITTCSGEVNTPIGGTDPQDPGDLEINNWYSYTYAFEDQWPLYGDYDMNDLVVRIGNMRLQKKRMGGYYYVDNLSFTCKVMAVGATKNLSLALQLDDISPAAIKSVTNNYSYSALGMNHFNQSGYIEYNQQYAVIPLFYSAHRMLSNNVTQINTIKQGLSGSTQEFTVNISFKNKALRELTIRNNFNLFIITDGQVNKNRKEIHLSGYKPTSLASTVFFNNNNDKSSRGYYTSEDNLPWGFLIAQDEYLSNESALWKWPQEYIPIITAYSKFADWVLSGGTTELQWYKVYDSDKVY